MCLLIRIISNGRNNVNEKGNNSFLNGRLMQKKTNDYMTAYNGASEYIIAVGRCHLPMNVDAALSIYIPKSAITSAKVYWQVSDSYNNTTSLCK